MPFTVEANAGISFVHENDFRMPSAPLLPLFKSVDHVAMHDDQANIDWSSIDFVTDRNGLRKLLRWINNTATTEFRIDMQLAGQRTVLFNRWEKRTREVPQWAYGLNFHKESTTPAPGCKLGSGHHRVITYVSFQFEV
jgi:hypothetical protein